MRALLRCLLLSLCFVGMGDAAAHTAESMATPPIRIGVLAFRPKPETMKQWAPLADVLHRAVPEREFLIEAMSYTELEAAIKSRQIDFVMTNGGSYVLLAHRHGLSAPLATRVNVDHNRQLSPFAGVIVSSAGRADIATLRDLRSKRIAVTSRNSLGGYQMQAFELLQAGVRLPDDATLVMTEMPHDNAVLAVLDGKADVGFVRTGVLEEMAAEGKLHLPRLKIVNRIDEPAYPLVRSTRLYPEWPFAALRHVDEDFVRRVTAALLLIKSNSEDAQVMGIAGFTNPADYSPVRDLLRALRMPPYEAAPTFTLRDVWARHKIGLSILLTSIIIIAILTTWLLHLNRRLVAETRTVRERSQELFLSESRFRGIIENAPIGMALTTPENQILQVNRALCDIVGYEPDELLHLGFERITHPGYLKTDESFNQRMARGEIRSYETEKRYVHKNGQTVWVLLSGSLLLDEAGQPLQVIKQMQDITDRKALEQKLEHQAHIDSLTGVANRGHFHELAAQELARSRRYRRPLSVAIADLDHFKQINDSYGHLAGDTVLQAFASLCRTVVREVDIIGRIGGEEFAILFPETVGEQACYVAERLGEAVASQQVGTDSAGNPLRVTVSFGVAELSSQDTDIDALLHRADQALYQAKRDGRNRTVLAAPA